jgi:SAM-dependent methyltransferase
MTTAVNEARLDELMHRMIGYMTGSAVCYGVWLGDELGLYRAMAAGGPGSAEEIAERAGCNPRLTAEWLDGQAAAGLVSHDPDAGTYGLSPEAALALADDSSPVFTARAMNALAAFYADIGKLTTAFRGDGGMSWADHDARLFQGTEWLFRTGYRAYLPGWIAALDGVEARLNAGIKVADVGCGHGASAIVMADAFPRSRFWGFDFHPPSVAVARQRAEEAGVADRVTFEAAPADGYPGTFDLICFFDCLHDMGDPVGAARYAREHLAPGGTVLLVEPFALDDHQANLTDNPVAPLFYHASSAICAPNSLSQDVGAALGAQAGEERLRRVFTEAGYSSFRRADETPMNLVLEARADVPPAPRRG